MKACMLFICLALTSCSSHHASTPLQHTGGDTENVNILVLGIGGRSCATWSAMHKNTGGVEILGNRYFSEALAYDEWVQGYITGRNSITSERQATAGDT